MPSIAERSLHTRIARSVDALKRSFMDNLFYVTARTFENATVIDHYTALAYTIRDRLLARYVPASQYFRHNGVKTVAYLSAEYLLGPQLGNNILNLKLWRNVRQAMEELGLDLDAILDVEVEPGLGNGGLGRLAACFMDSLATQQIPTIGYGIRYEYGIFEQSIKDGWQVEVADAWLRHGNPWELPRSRRFPVNFGGHLERFQESSGRQNVRWIPDQVVYGMAYDMPVLGYGVLNVNLLRLWKSEARESFNLHAFNAGDYYGAVGLTVEAENISKVLYPNDEPEAGKELRLRQQYFFVSCSIQDMIRVTLRDLGSLLRFPEKFVVQLNDTHPSLAIAEFMRLLIDEYQMEWDVAWGLTERSFAYTNHTLLPEALENWPIELFQRLLPRHLEIIYAINDRFLDSVRVRFINEPDRIKRMSLIDEGFNGGVRSVRMANLACLGSFSINGVAELHTELLKRSVLKDFFDFAPGKFRNKTNGVSPRRFIALANPALAALIDETIGPDWITNLDELQQLEGYVADAAFYDRWRQVKRQAKEKLSAYIQNRSGIAVDPDSLFDVQVKRIHEYKRQLLNILHVISLFHRIKEGALPDNYPRTFLFGGKAAPGYFMAKLIIKLIHSVADTISRDPAVSKLLKVVFIPDFNVKVGQHIYPAGDLSEQISTAGYEASGTGNMKFTFNGALTIGTLDGANIEIRKSVGKENFFLFGNTAQQVEAIKAEGYQPRDFYHRNELLRNAIDLINSGLFSHGNIATFQPIIDSLLNTDPFLVCADFQDYLECQERVGVTYQNQEEWTRMSILNVARSGKFSSDRAIREYATDIWDVEPHGVIV